MDVSRRKAKLIRLFVLAISAGLVLGAVGGLMVLRMRRPQPPPSITSSGQSVLARPEGPGETGRLLRRVVDDLVRVDRTPRPS